MGQSCGSSWLCISSRLQRSVPTYKFGPNEQVVVVNTKTEFNGSIAMIDAMPTDASNSRWTVRLSGKKYLLKEKNLESMEAHRDDPACNGCGKKQLAGVKPFQRCGRSWSPLSTAPGHVTPQTGRHISSGTLPVTSASATCTSRSAQK